MTAHRVETGFLDRSLTIGSATHHYVVYVPREYDQKRQWPVVLFLHGAGERGTSAWAATQVGIGTAIRLHPERFPAIVVFPVAPPNTRWIDEPADAAMAALDRAIAEFNGDPKRVYLTGISMGGYGTWHLALAHPGRFAAIVPVCGGIMPAPTATSVVQSPLTSGSADPYAYTANELRSIPVWIIHGAADPVIPVSESRKMNDALRAAGAGVRYTEYEGVGHGSWDRAYGEEKLWTWLFAQTK